MIGMSSNSATDFPFVKIPTKISMTNPQILVIIQHPASFGGHIFGPGTIVVILQCFPEQTNKDQEASLRLQPNCDHSVLKNEKHFKTVDFCVEPGHGGSLHSCELAAAQ
eukprot:scpid90417/ scgid14083/ 